MLNLYHLVQSEEEEGIEDNTNDIIFLEIPDLDQWRETEVLIYTHLQKIGI